MGRETLKSLLKNCGVDLYDTETLSENDRKIYRIYITSKDGVTLDKCEEVTKIISPILDTNPPIGGAYYLEVSSPGIERKLKTIDHFKASIGELVKIQTFQKEKLKGEILKIDDQNKIFIKDNSGEIIQIPFSDISKAKTYYQW